MSKANRILVIGSANYDLVLNVDHFPAAGETVLAQDMHGLPGGKGANQAYAARRLGAEVSFLGAVGLDKEGKAILQNLNRVGVNTDAVMNIEDVGTGFAMVPVNAAGENSIIVSPGANAQFSPEMIREHESLFEAHDIIMLQLEIPIETVLEAAKLAKSYSKFVR